MLDGAVLREADSKTTCIKVVVCAPKGGVGKTTIIRGLLVSAAKAGVNAVGINMDEQQTLTKWAAIRAKAREQVPELSAVTVWQHQLDDYRRIMAMLDAYDIAFFDTPPGHGPHASSIANLCALADLIIVPTSTSSDDIAEVKPFMSRVAGNKGAFVLNRINRRTASFARGRNELVQAGQLCPAEIPQLEDIHQYFRLGLTALDAPKASGALDLDGVWQFIRQRVGLGEVPA